MMSERIEQSEAPRPFGNLLDFVSGATAESELEIEVAVKDDGKCAIFHNKPFKNALSWLEFDLQSYRLDFVLDDGEIRDVGLPLTKDVSKNMQNSHQILMILMDEKTGEAKSGRYVPLILHGR
jgi:hypothetical protein